jgi:hypothetical protein
VTEEANDLPPKTWPNLLLFVLLAIGLMVGGMMMLGVPGALVAGVTAPIIEMLRGFKPGFLTNGDRALGVALLVTMIFPPGIPISYWISTLIWPKINEWLRALVIVAGTWVWSLLALLVMTFFI